MEIQNNISIFIESQFPSFFLDDGELLVKFIKYYYEWMESYENPIYVSKKIHEYHDVDKIPDKFYKFLREEFLKNVPNKNLVDESTLLKNIKDFYRAKGSEKAYKLLFRILYNEEIGFYYPGRDILRASDGKWVINKTIKVQLLINPDELDSVCLIYGSHGTGADKPRARIIKFLTYIESGVEVTEIYLSDIRGVFLQNEIVICGTTNVKIGIVVSNGIIEYDGYYEGTDGFLSWNKYLQDNYYYQEYSYVIKSGVDFQKYNKTVQKLIHPTGTLLFSQVYFELPMGYDEDSITFNSEIVTIYSEKQSYEYVINCYAYFQTSFAYTDSSSKTYQIELAIDTFYGNMYETNDYQYADATARTLYSNNILSYADIPIWVLQDVVITDLDSRKLLYARDDTWDFGNVSTITSFDRSPVDNQTLKKFITTANSANQIIYQSNSNIYSNTEYSISVYGREGSLSNIYFTIPSVGNADFNLNTVASNSSFGNATIIAANNNFYYCEWLVRPTTNSYFIISLNSNSANSESIYLWDLNIIMKNTDETFSANELFYISEKRNIPTRYLYNSSNDFYEFSTNKRIELYSFDNNKTLVKKIERKYNDKIMKLTTPIPYLYANNIILKRLSSVSSNATIESEYTDIYEETLQGVVLISNSVGAYTPSLITSISNNYIYNRRVMEGNNTLFDSYLPAGSIVKILDGSNTLVIVSENVSNNIVILRDSYSESTNIANNQYKYISI